MFLVMARNAHSPVVCEPGTPGSLPSRVRRWWGGGRDSPRRASSAGIDPQSAPFPPRDLRAAREIREHRSELSTGCVIANVTPAPDVVAASRDDTRSHSHGHHPRVRTPLWTRQTGADRRAAASLRLREVQVFTGPVDIDVIGANPETQRISEQRPRSEIELPTSSEHCSSCRNRSTLAGGRDGWS